jgi:hypothetical protein
MNKYAGKLATVIGPGADTYHLRVKIDGKEVVVPMAAVRDEHEVL